MITDIIVEESILLCTEFDLADELIYTRLDKPHFPLPACFYPERNSYYQKSCMFLVSKTQFELSFASRSLRVLEAISR
jgi:hypothetical protein